MGRVLTPYRAGVTTDGLKHNKYRSRASAAARAAAASGGCDIHAAFDSPTGLIYPAMDTGQPDAAHQRHRARSHGRPEDRQGARRRVRRHARRSKSLRGEGARSSCVAASTLESARLLLLSKSPQHPNGIGNSSGHVGHNFCEHVMGPSVTGLVKDLVGKPRTLDDGRPGRLLRAALPQPRPTSSRTSSAATASRAAAARGCFPATRRARRASARVQEGGARLRRRVHQHGRLRRGAAALRERGRARSRREGRVGHPGPAVPLQVRRQREEDGRGHGRHRAGDVRGGGHRDHRRRRRTCSPKAGRSTSSARRAWATIRRRPCSTSSSSRTT